MELINSLPRGSIAGNDDDGGYSISDSITKFQHDTGLKEDNRLGLSQGQKKLLYDLGMADINRVDQESFERESKAERRYLKQADNLYSLYRTFHPDDHPQDVTRAIMDLQQGKSASDLAAIADDPEARREAFRYVHEWADSYAADREYGTDYRPGTADNRTGGFSGFSGGGSYQPEEKTHRKSFAEGSLSDLIRKEQKRRSS